MLKVKRDYDHAAQEVRRLFDDGQYEAARRLAHSIKGVAGNLGAKAFQRAAQILENELKDNKLPHEALARFTAEMNTVQHALATISTQPAATTALVAAAVSPPDALIGAVQEILPHLKKRRPKPSKACLDGINALSWPAALTADVANLGRLVNRYQFKLALSLAERILTALTG